MGKEEFLRMLDATLDELHTKYNAAKSKLSTLEQDSVEYRQTEQQIEILRNEISTARRTLTSFAEARIQAMSDIELEEYKNNKISELESLYDFLSLKYITERKERNRYERQNHKLNSKAYADLMSETGKAEYRVKKEIQKTKEKSLKQIKEDLLADVRNSMTYKPGVINRELLKEQTEIIASVAGDNDKTQRMSELLKKHDVLLEEAKKIMSGIDFTIPSEFLRDGKWAGLNLEERMKISNSRKECVDPHFPLSDEEVWLARVYDGDFGSGQITVHVNWAFAETLRNFKKELDKYVEYALEILYGLNDVPISRYTYNMHYNELPSEELEELRKLLRKKERLSQRILKTERTESRLDVINAQIENLEAKLNLLYIKRVSSRFANQLGLGTNFQSFEELKQAIYEIKFAVAELIDNFQTTRKLQDIRVKNIVSDKNFDMYSLSKQIYDIAGADFFHTPEDFAGFEHRTFGKNAVLACADTVKREAVKEADAIKRETPQEIAKKEAAEKEAELKGLTIEELTAFKESMERIFNNFQSTQNATDREISPEGVRTIRKGIVSGFSSQEIEDIREMSGKDFTLQEIEKIRKMSGKEPILQEIEVHKNGPTLQETEGDEKSHGRTM